MSKLILVLMAAATQVGPTENPSAQVDFDFSCEMLLPTKGMAKLSGHVSYNNAPTQSDEIGSIKFTNDSTPQKLGAHAVAIGSAGAGLVLGIQQADGTARSFVLDSRPGGNASLLIAEGVVGRKMIALGYCDISGLKGSK